MTRRATKVAASPLPLLPALLLSACLGELEEAMDAAQPASSAACECSVEVPWSWSQQQDLWGSPALEWGDPLNERYFIVERVDKADFAEPMTARWMLESTTDQLTLEPWPRISVPAADLGVQHRVVDGHPAVRARGWAHIDGDDFAYVVTVVDYPDSMLVMWGWTLSEGQEQSIQVLERVMSRVRSDRPTRPTRVNGWAGVQVVEQEALTPLQAHSAEPTTATGETDWQPSPAESPPPGVQLVQYPSPAGPLAAYLTQDPGDGERRPAVLWAHPGAGAIGPWLFDSEAFRRMSDDSVTAFLREGLVVMAPSWRGELDNPGRFTFQWDELADLLAARDHLASLPWVDPERIYLVGEGLGANLVLLAAASTSDFRAAFAIGPNPLLSQPADGSALHPAASFNPQLPREYELRSPARFVQHITQPTFAFEGEMRLDTLVELESMQATAEQHGAPVHVRVVPLGSRGAIRRPLKRVIARKIIEDSALGPPIRFTPREMSTIGERVWSVQAPDMQARVDALSGELVEEGYLNSDELLASVLDSTSDLPNPPVTRYASARVKTDVRAHRKLERDYPDQTDCDRLDLAFTALETQGIMARQYYEDCGSCGYDALMGEVATARQQGQEPKGFVFFGWQDTRSAVEAGELLIAYSALAEDEAAVQEIGHTLVRELRAAGLTASWSGDIDDRVTVQMNWQRRLPPEALDYDE